MNATFRYLIARCRGLALAGAIALAGCGGGAGPDPTPTGSTPEPVQATPTPVTPGALVTSVPPAVCGGADLTPVTARIHVSPEGSDTSSCGTSQVVDATSSTTPCATIGHAIDRCRNVGNGCGVLVRWGRYELDAPVALAGGIGVYGSCRFGGEADQQYRSTLIGAADKPAVTAVGITSPTVFEGFQVIAGRSQVHGSASIAMLVRSSNQLRINHSQIVGGAGGDGANGSDGAMGVDGGNAGGASVRTAGVSSGPSPGGTGGGSVSACGAIAAGTAPTVGTWVLGGAGAPTAGNGFSCDGRPADYPGDGGAGAPGTAGSTGAGVAPAFSVVGALGTDGRWQPGAGANGIAGSAGSGGGGGSRGGGCEDLFNSYPGADGGGGGGGGTGGGGGGGGQQGGGSFALVLIDSTYLGQSSSLVAGLGGRGGNAGSGAPGGAGGAGAVPTTFPRNTFYGHLCPGFGGAGGAGGAGGGGSPGAAGNGGPSMAVATRGASPVPTGLLQVYLGTGGAPGTDAPAAGVKGWWRKTADEGGSFFVNGTWVRYGVDRRWLVRWVPGAATLGCNTTTFGGDPAVGTRKTCEFTDFVDTVAGEGGNFGVPDTATVIYGSGGGTVQRQLGPGTANCSNGYFGVDPSPNVPKQCQMLNVHAPAAPSAFPGAATRVADFEAPPTSTLYAGQHLPNTNTMLVSPDGRSRLVMQSDDNLVIYTDGQARWATGTVNSGAVALQMRSDGNAVLVNSGGGALWNTNTAGHPGAYLRLGNDGRLAVVESGNILWSTP